MNAVAFKRALRDTVAPVTRKLRRLVKRSFLRRVTYNGKMRLLQIQGEGGQPLSDIEHLEPFGFTSHPLPGAEPIAIAFNGNGSHTVVILVNDKRYRLVIDEGEAAMYNHHGDYVHIKNDRSIAVKAATRVHADTPEIYCTGIVKAADFMTHNGVSVDSHTHNENNVPGGATDGPNT